MKTYLRKTLDYVAGNIFNKLILLLLLPLFTRLLSPEEYAVYANLTIFVSLLSLLYLLGLQQAIFSHFYKQRENGYHFTLITSIYATLFAVGIILSICIVVWRRELALLILRDAGYAALFYWLSIMIFADVLYGMTLMVLNVMERSRAYVVVSACKNILLLMIVALISAAGIFDLNNLFFYLALAASLTALFSLWYIRGILRELSRDLVRKSLYSFRIMADLLKFGVPMIPGTLALMILRASDRYMLTYLAPDSLHAVGLYAVGYRIGMIMSFLTSIVSMVYFPYAMRIADRPEAAVSYRNMLKYYSVIGGFLGFWIVILAPEIFKIFIAPAYFAAVVIVSFGVASNFLHGAFNIVNLTFYVTGKSTYIALTVILGALLNIGLNLLFIPRWGISGAGGASVIAFLFIFCLNFLLARRFMNAGFRFLPVILSTAIMLLTAIINYRIPYTGYHTLLKVLLLLMMLGTVWLISGSPLRLYNKVKEKISL
ncbi:MAG: oligosaccharide flippase family protein [Candidatus Cloacimonetes bacterium]|nr:oligosaccharide flippase family protein [Candidatus Cloacimonadota bacterium]